MNNKPFINLFFRSEYSFLSSPSFLTKYVEFAKVQNIPFLVLTDQNVLFGVSQFILLCKQNNIKPIIGMEICLDKNIALVAIAKNNNGFKILNQLSLKISKQETININDLNNVDLLVLTSPNNNIEVSKKLIDSYDFIFHNIQNYKNEKYLMYFNTFVVDSYDFEKCQFLKILNQNLIIRNENELIYPININNETEKEKIYKILEQINYDFDSTISLPKLNVNQKLKNKIVFEIENNLNLQKELKVFGKDEVNKRIKQEFDVISSFGFEDYFLIIEDLISWSKKNNISIGPGRGSVCGSLIAYILGISKINPLKYNLLFERFLNPQRINIPDIDIDIQDNKRDLVIDYLKEKYGYDNVANIITFQRIGPKLAIKDVGRILNFSFSELNLISKLITNNESLNNLYQNNSFFRAKIQLNEKNENLFNKSLLIENLIRQKGIHAAGVVLSSEPLINKIPLIEENNLLISQFSMEYLEHWGLVKIDLLGLKTLTIIENIIESIKTYYHKTINDDDINLNDEETIKLINSGNLMGVFQLESSGMIRTITKVKIDSFEDLIAIIALYRPGPLNNISKFATNKNNPKNIENIFPPYDNVLKETYGIIIYQEQIMQIAQVIASFSFAKADLLRRAISKKDPLLMEELKNDFFKGALEKGLNKNIIEKIYEQIQHFASYGFNKSHAVAYAFLSFKMAFLKAKFPFSFYQSIINENISSQEEVIKYITEAKKLNILVESPSINNLTTPNNFEKQIIFLPIIFIKGIGENNYLKLVEEFKQKGKYKDFYDFVLRAKTIKLSDSIIQILIESNTLREFGNIKTLLSNLNNALNYAKLSLLENKNTNEIEILTTLPKPDMVYEEDDLILDANYELKYLSCIFNAFPTAKYEQEEKLINLKVGIEYVIPLFIDGKEEGLNKYKKEFFIIKASDSSLKIDIFLKNNEKDLYDMINPKTIGKAYIVKSIKNGVVYYNLKKWRQI